MHDRNFSRIFFELSDDVVELFDEDFPMLLRQEVLLDELIGDVFGHEVDGGELEGNGLLLGRLHLTLDFEARLDLVDVEHFQPGPEVCGSFPARLATFMSGFGVFEKSRIRVSIGTEIFKILNDFTHTFIKTPKFRIKLFSSILILGALTFIFLKT